MNFEVILHFVKDSVLIMLAFIEFFYQNCLTNERRKKENKFRNPESHSVFMKCQRTYVLKKKACKMSAYTMFTQTFDELFLHLQIEMKMVIVKLRKLFYKHLICGRRSRELKKERKYTKSI